MSVVMSSSKRALLLGPGLDSEEPRSKEEGKQRRTPRPLIKQLDFAFGFRRRAR